MAFPSLTGDPDTDKKLWWRCVIIAAAVQPVLLLLSLIFQTTAFLKILYFPCVFFMMIILRMVVTNPTGSAEGVGASLSVLGILLPVCFVLYSFVLGTIFYFVYWLSELDY